MYVVVGRYKVGDARPPRAGGRPGPGADRADNVLAQVAAADAADAGHKSHLTDVLTRAVEPECMSKKEEASDTDTTREISITGYAALSSSSSPSLADELSDMWGPFFIWHFQSGFGGQTCDVTRGSRSGAWSSSSSSWSSRPKRTPHKETGSRVCCRRRRREIQILLLHVVLS